MTLFQTTAKYSGKKTLAPDCLSVQICFHHTKQSLMLLIKEAGPISPHLLYYFSFGKDPISSGQSLGFLIEVEAGFGKER